MCIPYLGGKTVKGPHMSDAMFDRVASSVFPFVKRWQPTVSGEPTMSKHFARMLDIAGEYGVKIEMVTNATLLNDRMIDALAPGLGSVTFSFDSHDAETYEEIREGADFERVVGKIRQLMRRAKEKLPESERPVFGFNCTLMEPNIRHLAELVTFASEEIGVDFVTTHHVFPVTDEVKARSLVHYRELAQREIDRAIREADRTGITLIVNALDLMTATTALGKSERDLPTRDGVVEGLEARHANVDKLRKAPLPDLDAPDNARVSERRNEAARDARFPRPYRRTRLGKWARLLTRRAPRRGSRIGYCEFLWTKTYIQLDGKVSTCCVHKAPVVGSLEDAPLDEVWNNETYRTMRKQIVLQDPVPACRGCMHIREITDPGLIDLALQGKEIPDPS